MTVCAIPGPCALVTALSISGLPTGRFCFEGFLSINKKSRQEHLSSLKNERRTMIFYEAPHKLLATLKDMAANFGEDRRVSLCRELTKLHEEVVRTTLGEAVARYTENPPRGEFVVVIEGAQEVPSEELSIEAGGGSCARRSKKASPKRTPVKLVAKQTGLPRNALYEGSLAGRRIIMRKIETQVRFMRRTCVFSFCLFLILRGLYRFLRQRADVLPL